MSKEFNFGMDGIDMLQRFNIINLEDVRFGVCEEITEDMINDLQFELVNCILRRSVQAYFTGVYRAEVLQDTTKTINLSTPYYPASLWDCVKFYINQSLGTHFKVKETYEKQTVEVTFKRRAVYPRMPSLRKEYGVGKYVIKESITEERRDE